MPLHEPPVRVKAAAWELCAAIRQGTQPVYADLARASVISVLQDHLSPQLPAAGRGGGAGAGDALCGRASGRPAVLS